MQGFEVEILHDTHNRPVDTPETKTLIDGRLLAHDPQKFFVDEKSAGSIRSKHFRECPSLNHFNLHRFDIIEIHNIEANAYVEFRIFAFPFGTA